MTSSIIDCKIPGTIECVGKAVDQVLDGLYDIIDFSDETLLFDIKVILNELLLNAVLHGNKGDRAKKVTVRASVEDGGSYLYLSVEDEGEGFNYREILSNAGKECFCFDCLKETGRGLIIAKSLSDKLMFNDKGNQVVVMKKLSD